MINLSSYDTTPNEKSQLFKILLKLKKKKEKHQNICHLGDKLVKV